MKSALFFGGFQVLASGARVMPHFLSLLRLMGFDHYLLQFSGLDPLDVTLKSLENYKLVWLPYLVLLNKVWTFSPWWLENWKKRELSKALKR